MHDFMQENTIFQKNQYLKYTVFVDADHALENTWTFHIDEEGSALENTLFFWNIMNK